MGPEPGMYRSDNKENGGPLRPSGASPTRRMSFAHRRDVDNTPNRRLVTRRVPDWPFLPWQRRILLLTSFQASSQVAVRLLDTDRPGCEAPSLSRGPMRRTDCCD